jgi:hypothetical protein
MQAWPLRPGGELARPVPGRSRSGPARSVSRLAGRPWLPLTRRCLARLRTRPRLRCLSAPRPAGLAVARPGLLSGRVRASLVRAWRIRAWRIRACYLRPGHVRTSDLGTRSRHVETRTRHIETRSGHLRPGHLRPGRVSAARVRAGRRVSRCRPAAGSRPRRPRLRRRPGRLPRPALRLPLCLTLRLSGVGLPRVTGMSLPRRLRGPPGEAAWVTAWSRSRPARVIDAGRARTARRRGALRAGGRWPGPRSRACLPRPRAADPGHRVVGPLPRTAVRRGIVGSLPGRAWLVPGPWRHAPFLPRPGRSRRHVRGPWPLAVLTVRVALVAGVNGVGARFQVGVTEVGVTLIGVAVGVGSAAGAALCAPARPAPLTTHPLPPATRHAGLATPRIECRADASPGQGRRVIDGD